MLPLSLIALFVGPLVYAWLQKGGRVAKTLDRVLVGILAVTLGVFLLPHLWEGLGYWSLLLIGAGYLLPGILEKTLQRAAETLHVFNVMLALFGLLLHAMLDGAGLGGSGAHSHDFGLGLEWAIVLHRLGVGLIVWMIVQPAFGATAGWLTLALMALATVAGYALAAPLLAVTGADAWPVIAALIAGTILHSLIHRGHMHTHHD